MIIKSQPGLQNHIWSTTNRNDDGKKLQKRGAKKCVRYNKTWDSAEYRYLCARADLFARYMQEKAALRRLVDDREAYY